MNNDPERSGEQVSAEGIQQILAELRKLNRRMDTLNARLFGNPEGDAGDDPAELDERQGVSRVLLAAPSLLNPA